MTEQWRDIPGTNGRYRVSDQGRVLSLVRNKPKLLTQRQHRSGHMRVTMDGARHVHELVLISFTGPKPKGTQCRHLDGDPTNNTWPNLVWDEQGANIRDRKWHGAPRKLSVRDVINIKKELASGVTGASLANDYGVCKKSIYRIKHGVDHYDV